MKIFELYTFRPVHDIHTYRHGQTILLISNLLDFTDLTLPQVELQDDRIAHRHIANRLSEENLQLATLEGRTQLLHLDIGNGHLMTIGIAIVVKMRTGTGIPLGIDDVVNALFGNLHKHKASQVVTQLIIGGRSQELEGNKELVRWQRLRSILQ